MYRSGVGCDWRGALLVRWRAVAVRLGRFFALDDFELVLRALLFVDVDDFFVAVRLAVAATEALPNRQSTRMRVRAFCNFKVPFYHRLTRLMT